MPRQTGVKIMSDEQNLVSDLAEISADLAAWAQDKISEGKTVDEIQVMMLAAARFVRRERGE